MDRLRILIVEDRPADAELMVAELRRAGLPFDWQRVDTERAYLAALESPVDLILADFNMPQFTGLQACRIVRERSLDIPFILVSGSIGEEIAVNALREGAADYLLKDRLTRLGAAATSALEAKRLRDKERQAEQALRDSELRYRSLFEDVPMGLYRSTPSGQLLDVNPAMVRMLGYPDRKSLLAVNAADLYVDPSERQGWTVPLEQQEMLLQHEQRLRRRDGTVIWVRGTARAVRDNAGPVQHYDGTLEDITESRQAQEALRQHEERWRALIDNSSDAIALLDPQGTIRYASSSTTRITGYSVEEFTGRSVFEFLHPGDADLAAAELANLLQTSGAVRVVTLRVRVRNGAWRWFEFSGMNLLAQPSVQAIVVNFRDITDRRMAEEHLAEERTLLRTMTDSLPDFISVKDKESRYVLVNKAYADFLGQPPTNLIGKTVWDVFPQEFATNYIADDQTVLRTGQALLNQESRTVDRFNSVRWHAVSKVPFRNSGGEPVGLVSIARDITDRKLSEQQIARQLETLTALYAGAQKLSQSLDTDNLARYVVETSVNAFGARLAWAGQAEPDGTIRLLKYWPSEHAYPATIATRWDDSPPGQSPAGRAVRARNPVVVQDIASEPGLDRPGVLRELGITEIGAFPLISRDQAFGVLVLYSDRADFFNPTRLEFLQAFANQAAAALENARLFDETHGRIRQLQALRNIDIAITASLDLRVTLNVILDQTTTHLKVDAANVLVFDPHTQTLRHGTNRGFRTAALRGTNLRLGEGHAGRAALDQRMIRVPNLAVEMSEFARSKHLPEERFVAYVATPLMAKGQVKGVLEIFHRAPLNPTPDWFNFLEALAGQAAIAVDNSSLFDNLQRVNTELTLAYDTTLEGWSKALDLRDNETEGHTLRVTDLTLRLARAVGIEDEELTHIRRGALLHDIGKMGIPDKILLKPGPLTDEEWVVMKKHPVYAYELLARIPFLRLALDIPYCHHEKWDGTGYPRGLKQEGIPRAARIFAVIDVYDALSSDRPYRKAWAKDKVVTYIREQAGKHFDPTAAAQFLAMEMP